MPDNKKNLETIRHSLAHIMAYAISQLYPGAKFGVGPVIEDGFYYDFLTKDSISVDDLPKIESAMRRIIKRDIPFDKKELPIDQAISIFEKNKQDFKVELIEDLKKNGTTDLRDIDISDLGVDKKVDKITTVSVYETGDFMDLCRGPHVKSTGEVGAFKLTKVSGAYWRGDKNNPQMQRIYGVAFERKNELDDYSRLQEEAQKRDHRKLAQQLDLFMQSEIVGAGLPMLLPNGEKIKSILKQYMREKEESLGYQYVSTPALAHEKLYEKSGHVKYYTDDMFSLVDSEGQKFYLKPMNCPHHHLIYQKMVTSYRDLPLKLAEDDGLYRHELSGTLTGLIRIRGPITQNDAHIYVDEKQCEQEFGQFIDLFKEVYKQVGIEDYWFRLSLPDFEKGKFIGDKKIWREASDIIRRVLKAKKIDFQESMGEAAFYGPKADIQVKNVLGKEDTIATCQIDILIPQRMGLKYIDQEGKEKTPLVIHRAILGSYERFIAFMLEQTAGKLPVWLSPEQVRILPVSEKFIEYSQKVLQNLAKDNIRVNLDDSNESLGKKIRNGEMMKIPYLLVIGEKEQKSDLISVRNYKKGDLGNQKLADFTQKILREIENKS